jgi:iron complex outermembrane receptor protein
MVSRNARSLLLGSSACAMIALSQAVTAADEDSAAAAGPLEEVVVTAQKRTENLQTASVAVDVASSEDIARQGISYAIDLQQIVPEIRFVSADQMTVLIRGLGTINDNPGVDSAVAYSQDGIYLAHPEALTPVLFDLQRVETVLGPQGTLYGRNATAGVINFVTNDPGPTFGGYARVGYGNYADVTSEAALNLPLGGSWFLRIAEGTDKHSPYDRDGSNDQDAYAARAKLLYDAGGDLRVLWAVDGARRNSVGNSYGGVCPPGNIVPGCANVPWVPWSGLQYAPSAINDDTLYGTSLTINYDLAWAELVSLTGFRSYNFNVDTDPGWYNGVDEFDYLHPDHSRFFTQEVRLSNAPSSKITWVGGLFYSHESEPTYTQFDYNQTVLQAFYGLPPGYFQKLAIVSSDYQSEAAFGDVTVPLVGGVRLRAGLRVTHESKDSTGTSESGVLGPPESLFGPLETNRAVETITKPTWKVGLDYDVTAKNLLYATVSTGFKSGGINNLPPGTGLTTYAPETITAVEVGSKNRFFDDHLQINASIFHYDYKGYQTFEFYQPTGGPFAGATLFPTLNSQTATFEGGELQIKWAVTTDDTVGLDVNVLHNRFDTFYVALPYSPPVDLSGTPVPLSPQETYFLNYRHTFRLPVGALSFGVDSQYVLRQVASGNQGATANDALYWQPSYHKSNANLSFEVPNSGWTIYTFVRNIENKAVVNTVAGGYPILQNVALANAMLDQPRTFGVSIRKDF